MKTLGIIKKYFSGKNLKKSPGFWASFAAVLVLAAAFQNCGGQLKRSQLLPSQLIHSADGQSAQGCTLAMAPMNFEPNPPGVPRPCCQWSSGYNDALRLYQRGAGGPRRILMMEAWGYSILDISHPLNPTAPNYYSFLSQLQVGGDGQSMVQTISVSPDGQRAAFSLSGPGDPYNTVVASGGGEGFSIGGSMPAHRESGTVIHQAGSRYIVYNIAVYGISAADVTTLPEFTDWQAIDDAINIT